MEYKQLIEIAFELRENAYAPYTGFKSAAVLLSAGGVIYAGCNVEISALNASSTAVQSAFLNAIVSGERKFSAIAIVGGVDDCELDYAPPTGICRQIIQEFCSNDFKIILAKSNQDFIVYEFEDLFPVPFNKKNVIGE
jgi:cytidine deaminase